MINKTSLRISSSIWGMGWDPAGNKQSWRPLFPPIHRKDVISREAAQAPPPTPEAGCQGSPDPSRPGQSQFQHRTSGILSDPSLPGSPPGPWDKDREGQALDARVTGSAT